MAAPVTQTYDKLVVEFSDDGGTTWARNCVIEGATVTRTSNVEDAEIPADCNDETLPHNVFRSVRSISLSVSGTGHWTQGGYDSFLTKWHAGTKPLARIGNLGAASGEIEYEQFDAVIDSLGQARTVVGQPVTAEVSLSSAGPITTTTKT